MVYVVTDPMCSWCWGMSAAVEEAAHRLAGEVCFDLLLGGINTHATQPVGEFGRHHLLALWREVQATTGRPFGFELPEDFVYNSTLPCVALEAFRRRTGLAPFGLLHRLQQCLFEEGQNIAAAGVLDRVAEEFGWARGELRAALRDPELRARARAQFAVARSYGTHALPSVLLEVDGQRRLVFGGYADSEMMVGLVRDALARSAR